MVDVVQLVEHRIVVPSVVGSSPIIHPKRKALFARAFSFGVNTGGAAPSYTPAAFSPSTILPGGKIPGTAGALQSASSLRSSIPHTSVICVS